MLCCGYTLTDFPISIRLTSLALWQSNDCHSASKATLMNIDKYFMWIHYERLHNHNKTKHNKTVCIFLGIYCTSERFLQIRPPRGTKLPLLETSSKKKLQWHSGDDLSSLIVKYKSVSEDKKWISCRHFCFSAVIEWIQNKTKKSYISKNYHNEAKIKWPPFC